MYMYAYTEHACMHETLSVYDVVFIRNLTFFSVYSHYVRIFFEVGVSRSCGRVFIPGNTYLDKLEREREIIFEVEQNSTNATLIEFNRPYAWVFIADDDSKLIILQVFYHRYYRLRK